MPNKDEKSLEEQLKTEYYKKEARHEVRNFLQNLGLDIPEFIKNQALNNQKMDNVTSDVSQMKSILKEHIIKIEETYVTEKQFKEKITSMNTQGKIFIWIGSSVMSVMSTVIIYILVNIPIA